MDFDTDNSIWTINQYAGASYGTISIILEISEGNIEPGAELMLVAEHDMYTVGIDDDYPCIIFEGDCGPYEWGNPDLFEESYLIPCPVCCADNRHIYGKIKEGVTLSSGNRYLLGSVGLSLDTSGECSSRLIIRGECDHIDHEAWAPAWLESDPNPVKQGTWGKVKSLY
ncbi:MAG: hypothetical protein KJ970_07535 [Candidatus Eisenbacteria bacterium]|uniref:Uncharacterized protein n=1 Tax=Eiseniibacteriota bacterium TaxID=2212470 RepID=A0A948RVJ8_UNCEI|nr:hypothetical protein [Candidatus Eisenbacteria bacterium]MBU1950465.1 hypothetical protein [Candidatus Eisenbacteria bacterium]MBU2690766.1 hypothetical protein [Candidatus Eisenbacteria bacterium]